MLKEPKLSRWPASMATIGQRVQARALVSASGCWVWQGSTNGAGYGQMRRLGGGDKALAHRLSYEAHRGPIPIGMELDHLCRNTLCVNPDHLEPVQHRENIRRGYAATRTHCPSGHEYTGDNLIKSRQHRACRLCNNARMRALRKSKSASRKG